MNPSDNKNNFTSPVKWEIIAVESYDPEKGWTAREPYEKCLTWEFRQEKTTEYPDGSDEYSGILTEHFEDGHEKETEFHYYGSDKQLYIDRSVYTRDGYTDYFFNDRYRITEGGNGDYILYDLDEVETEPDDYYGRIIVAPHS